MDVDDFLCSLQEHYCVHLPVFAVRRPDGSLATENATDGTRSLVLLTDHDLLERYLVRVRRGDPVRLSTPAELGGFLAAVDRLGTRPTYTQTLARDPTAADLLRSGRVSRNGPGHPPAFRRHLVPAPQSLETE